MEETMGPQDLVNKMGKHRKAEMETTCKPWKKNLRTWEKLSAHIYADQIQTRGEVTHLE